MNNSLFYAALRKRGAEPMGGKISQQQVNGTEAILNEAVARNVPQRYLAYMLATAYHETASTMQPVRETMAKTDAGAISILDRAFAKGQLKWVKTPYWRLDESGKSWLGRGLVQLTHKINYDKIGTLIGEPLIYDPARAMDMGIAVKIMFEGMALGTFTGRKLADYFNDKTTDWKGARAIINGKESADKVAGYAVAFNSALEAAGYSHTGRD